MEEGDVWMPPRRRRMLIKLQDVKPDNNWFEEALSDRDYRNLYFSQSTYREQICNLISPIAHIALTSANTTALLLRIWVRNILIFHQCDLDISQTTEHQKVRMWGDRGRCWIATSQIYPTQVGIFKLKRRLSRDNRCLYNGFEGRGEDDAHLLAVTAEGAQHR